MAVSAKSVLTTSMVLEIQLRKIMKFPLSVPLFNI